MASGGFLLFVFYNLYCFSSAATFVEIGAKPVGMVSQHVDDAGDVGGRAVVGCA